MYQNKFIVRTIAVLVLWQALSHLNAATVQVRIQNNVFNPRNVTIQEGDTVVWVMQGQNHDTVSEDGLWSSGILSPGQTFPFTFDTAGTYDYFCTPHRLQGMTGRITVGPGAANTPPTVSITAPTEGTNFPTGQNITFSANATDNGSVGSVEFFANGNSIGSDTSSPFSISVQLAAGSYAITARATDNQNASTTSSPVNITVTVPNAPPTVAITAPNQGATFSTTDNITITATAADNGRVTAVELLANGTLLARLTGSPYSITTNLLAGNYALTARATDNLGASATSETVTITVENAQAAQPTFGSITRNENTTTLTGTGTSGVVHTLEATSNLTTWTTVGTVTPENGAFSMTDETSEPWRLYRLVIR